MVEFSCKVVWSWAFVCWKIIIGVPEEENKKKDHEKILEIIVENFPKVGKEIITQVQETKRVPNRKTQGKTLQDTY